VKANNKAVSGPPADSSWLKLPEAAADMRISLSMLHKLIKDKKIKVVHPGPQTTRVPRSSIQAYEAALLADGPADGESEDEQQAGAA
jgi:excisionase family DNA binding protein